MKSPKRSFASLCKAPVPDSELEPDPELESLELEDGDWEPLELEPLELEPLEEPPELEDGDWDSLEPDPLDESLVLEDGVSEVGLDDCTV